jgi:hypothetical protein
VWIITSPGNQRANSLLRLQTGRATSIQCFTVAGCPLLRGQAVVHRCSLSSDFIRARTLDAIAAQKVPEYFGNLLGPGFIQGDVSPEFIGRVP